MQTYKLEVTETSFRHKCREIGNAWPQLHFIHVTVVSPLSFFLPSFELFLCYACIIISLYVSSILHLFVSYRMILLFVMVFLVIRCTGLVYLSHVCVTSLTMAHYFQHYRRPVNKYMTSSVFIIVPPHFFFFAFYVTRLISEQSWSIT